MIVVGLSIFEVVNSVDNAIINSEVLSTMPAKSRKWFLTWGIIIAVFLVRGLLPILILWGSNPTLSFLEVATAMVSSNGRPGNSRHRSPSKRGRDRTRIERFEEQRKERLALFGYVKTKNGLTYSIGEASSLLVKGVLRAEDIETWSIPESFTDVLNSIGERDAVADYPALGIVKGTVLVDPKIRVPGGHRDPALRREAC